MLWCSRGLLAFIIVLTSVTHLFLSAQVAELGRSALAGVADTTPAASRFSRCISQRQTGRGQRVSVHHRLEDVGRRIRPSFPARSAHGMRRCVCDARTARSGVRFSTAGVVRLAYQSTPFTASQHWHWLVNIPHVSQHGGFSFTFGLASSHWICSTRVRPAFRAAVHLRFSTSP